MDMDTALKNLTRERRRGTALNNPRRESAITELNALEMEIRSRGFVLAACAADEGAEAADPRIADTRVGYFGIWE